VGTLTALAVLVIIGLIGLAIGAHVSGPSSRILSWRGLSILTLAFSIGGAFFSFVAGGWVATRIAGLRRPETAMMHGAITWLIAVPVLLVVAAIGGGSVLGGWYSGLGGTPAWAQAPPPPAVSVTDPEVKAKEAEEDKAARATRNAALGALTALLLGLVGSVLGSWLGSGAPMNFSHLYTDRTQSVEKREPVTV